MEKITSSKEVNKKSETLLHVKNERVKSHQNELDTMVDEIIPFPDRRKMKTSKRKSGLNTDLNYQTSSLSENLMMMILRILVWRTNTTK